MTLAESWRLYAKYLREKRNRVEYPYETDNIYEAYCEAMDDAIAAAEQVAREVEDGET